MYDVSKAKYALRILRNPKIELVLPLSAEDMFEKHADFVILRHDDRAVYSGEQKVQTGFWYSWIGFSKKHPNGYTEKNWQQQIEKQDSEKIVVTTWNQPAFKPLPLAHIYFDSDEELQAWFGEERWANLVMKLII